MKHYRDYIGTKILWQGHCSTLFLYSNSHELLKKVLYMQIQSELTYQNGLICKFDEVTYKVISTTNEVKITAIVTQCEVDC